MKILQVTAQGETSSATLSLLTNNVKVDDWERKVGGLLQQFWEENEFSITIGNTITFLFRESAKPYTVEFYIYSRISPEIKDYEADISDYDEVSRTIVDYIFSFVSKNEGGSHD